MRVATACLLGVVGGLGAGLLLPGVAGGQPYKNVDVAVLGDAAPGTGGGTFSSFGGEPAINAAGDVAFLATVGGGTASSGVFLYSGGTLSAVALQGASAPGTSGSYTAFSAPALNDGGDVAFVATTSGVVTSGIFLVSGGGHFDVVLAGQSAPGTGGGNYSNFGSPALNGLGDVAFVAAITGGTVGIGYFLDVAGTQSAVALEGETAPGTGGGIYGLTGTEPSLNDAGGVAFYAGISGGSASAGIFVGTTGADAVAALAGDAAPGTGGGTYSGFDPFPSLDASGDVAFRAVVSGGSGGEGLFVDSAGTDSALVLTGDPAPSTGGGSYGTFQRPSLDSDGSVAFWASVTGGTASSGIFLDTVDTALALAGASAPGTGGGSYLAFGQRAANAAGRVAFFSGVTGGSAGSGIFLASPRGPDEPFFTGLGDLAGDGIYSQAFGISADGQVIVGQSGSASGNEAFSFTEPGGLVGLGDLAGGVFSSQAWAASSDGSVVAGQGSVDAGTEAFRWTSGGGMQPLGNLPGGAFYSAAFDVSGDGEVVVGESSSASGTEAFRWTSAGSMVGLGDLPGGGFGSSAQASSADGSVVVGWGASGITEAFRWTSGGGMVGLGELPGGDVFSQAFGVSPDGSIVVGYSGATSSYPAFLWTQAKGITNLGLVPGGSQSWGRDVSADGSRVVGAANNFQFSLRPAIWSKSYGMRWLPELLSLGLGLDLAGWQLFDAYAISDDGRTIVGTGVNPAGQSEGWLAYVPELPASYTVFRFEGQGVPVPVFDQGRGTLQAVRMRVRYQSTDSTSTGPHAHPAPFQIFVITTAAAGSHSPFVSVPNLSANGLTIPGFGTSSLAEAGSHTHVIFPGNTTTSSDDVHGHSGTLTVDQELTFGSGQLAPFLGPSDFVIPGASFPTNLIGDHFHTSAVGNTGPGGGHPHTVFPDWRTETTFLFDAFPACSDTLDNDADGYFDTEDPGCEDVDDETETTVVTTALGWFTCDNGLDDDGDGLIDVEEDPGCREPLSYLEDPACDDGLDNDGDTFIDFGTGNDPGCTTAWDGSEGKPGAQCGLGYELILLLPPLFWLRRRRAASRADVLR